MNQCIVTLKMLLIDPTHAGAHKLKSSMTKYSHDNLDSVDHLKQMDDEEGPSEKQIKKEKAKSEYLNKIDNLPKQNIDQISSNLKELYNRILIENKT